MDFFCEHDHQYTKFKKILAKIKENQTDDFETRLVYEFLRKNKNTRFIKDQIDHIMNIIDSKKYEEAQKKKLLARQKVVHTSNPDDAIKAFSNQNRGKTIVSQTFEFECS